MLLMGCSSRLFPSNENIFRASSLKYPSISLGLYFEEIGMERLIDLKINLVSNDAGVLSHPKLYLTYQLAQDSTR